MVGFGGAEAQQGGLRDGHGCICTGLGQVRMLGVVGMLGNLFCVVPLIVCHIYPYVLGLWWGRK